MFDACDMSERASLSTRSENKLGFLKKSKSNKRKLISKWKVLALEFVKEAIRPYIIYGWKKLKWYIYYCAINQ